MAIAWSARKKRFFSSSPLKGLQNGWRIELSTPGTKDPHVLYILMGSENSAGAFHDQHASKFKVGAMLTGVSFYMDEIVAIEGIRTAP